MLAAFVSVVNAVDCAIETQTTLEAENATPPRDLWLLKIPKKAGTIRVLGDGAVG